MKFLLPLLFTTLLISCSQKKQTVEEKVFEFNAGIGIFTGNAEFGTLKSTDSKVITLKVTNTGDAPLQGPPTLDNSNFTIIYQNGCSSIAPTKSCSMKVSFDAKSKAPGQEYLANLNLDSTFLELKGSIEAAPPLVPCCGYIFSQTQVDFGPVPTGKTIVKTLSIKNTEAPFVVAPISVPSDFLLVYDTCSSKTIPNGGSCSFKVALRGIDKADIRRGGVVNGNIIILGQSISLSGELLESNDVSAPVAVSNVVSIVNNLEVTTVNAGSISGSNSKQIIFNLKNTGNAPTASATAVLNNSNASILFNQCVNKVLAPSSSCQVRVVVSAANRDVGGYSSRLTFANSIADISYAVSSLTDVITYAPVYEEYGSCSAALACSGSGTKTRTMSACQKLSNGSPITGGQLSDCSSFNVAANLEASCLSPAGEKTVEVANGDQVVSCIEGSNVQNFISLSCDNEYTVSGQVCSPTVCTLDNAVGNGLISIDQVLAVSGTINNNSCVVDSCNIYYNNTITSCSEKSCTQLNSSELTSLGYDLTGAIISGTYPSCSISCSSSFQQVSASDKSCEDKLTTGSISFDQDYSNSLTGNLINITQTNAQQIQFYSDASCSTPVGTALSMPLLQTSLNLSSVDGTKNAYAKLINGTARSSCLTDSIILDQTSPVIVINSPTSNQEITANSLTVTGTCLETNPPVFQIGLTINGVIQNVNCVSGTFSSTFNITSVAFGIYSVSATASDSLNNTTNTSVSFNRNIITYVPSYSSYGSCSASLPCDGTGAQSRTITSCQKLLNNDPVAGGILTDCSGFNTAENLTQSCQSPSGNLFSISVLGGYQNQNCAMGDPVPLSTDTFCYNQYVSLANTCDFTPTSNFLKYRGIAEWSSVNPTIYVIKKLADGSYIYAGDFTRFVDSAGITHSVGHIIKLNADGTVNTEFKNNIGTGFNNRVKAIYIDGNDMYVGGIFTGFNGGNNNARSIAKLTTTGIFNQIFSDNLDAVSGIKAITSGFNSAGSVETINMIGSDLYVGGSFTQFKTQANNARYIAKLTTTGIFNQVFSDNLDVVSGIKAATSGFGGTQVFSIAVDSANNSLYVGGLFTTFKGVANSANRIAKLNTNGELDATFMNNLDVVSENKATTSGFNGTVSSIVYDNVNNLYIAGAFGSFKGSNTTNRIAKISTSGVLDTAFMNNLDVVSGTKASTSGFNSAVNSVALDSVNNVLYVGGTFTSLKGGTNSANRIAKLSTSGVVDTTFMNNLDVIPGTKDTTSGSDGNVNTVSLAGDEVHLGGSFYNFRGVTANHVVRINATGKPVKLIESAAPFDYSVNKTIKDSNGNFYIVGSFTAYNGIYSNKIVKLNPDLTINNDFVDNIGSGFNGAINDIRLDSNGNLYVVGAFTSFNGIVNNARYIAKLNTDGVFDQNFSDNLDVVPGTKASTSGFNTTASKIVSDGSNVYVGGSFTSFKGIANNARYVAKLSNSGIFNQSFSDNLDVILGTKAATSGFSTTVSEIAIDSTNLYIGGSFTSFKGIANNARYIAKLNTDGIFDQAFSDNIDVVPGTKAATSGFNGVSVKSILIDGTDLYVGGSFDSFKSPLTGGTSPYVRYNANGIAKLDKFGNFNETFSNNLDVVLGTKSSSTSGFSTNDTNIITTDGTVLYVGGRFTNFKGTTNNARYISSITKTGTANTTFSNKLDLVSGTKATTSGFNGFGGEVYHILVDGTTLYISGSFLSFKGEMNKYILKFTP